MKLCKTCNTLKDITLFGKYKYGKDGINSACKSCVSLVQKKSRQKCKENFVKNKEKVSVKTCSICKAGKSIEEFGIDKYSSDGYRHSCKNCESTRSKQSRKPLSEKQKKQRITYSKEYYKQNKERIKESSRNNASKNKERVKEYKKNYRLINKANRNKKERDRRKNDPLFRLNESMSKQINRIKNVKNGVSWKRLLDYTFDDLKKHLESKFTTGMTWGNHCRHGWHIDHIVPVSSFNYDSADHPEFKKCWALSNLQPLWATKEIAMSYGESFDYIGNLEKGDRAI